MNFKYKNIFFGLFSLISAILTIPLISSCGKSGAASPTGLNVQYRILNLSPDLSPINLFINFTQVNTTPFVFTIDHGYFYVPSLVNPYQFRSALVSGTTLFSRSDTLQTGLKYTLFITGQVKDGSLKQIFTVDTVKTLPPLGLGKVRFVNASPSATGGLDVAANGTPAFSKILYTKFSQFIELPVGNYDFQITSTGSSGVLKDLPAITIQDGRVYTLYAYGYTSRIDTAAFNAAVITNR